MRSAKEGNLDNPIFENLITREDSGEISYDDEPTLEDFDDSLIKEKRQLFRRFKQSVEAGQVDEAVYQDIIKSRPEIIAEEEFKVVMEHARQEAGENAWVKESLSSLERYAKRKERRAFSKEALYSADKFRSRLSSTHENTEVYNASQESAKPMYLRRKQERGKRM